MGPGRMPEVCLVAETHSVLIKVLNCATKCHKVPVPYRTLLSPFCIVLNQPAGETGMKAGETDQPAGETGMKAGDSWPAGTR